jgi:fumarate reductase subunit C
VVNFSREKWSAWLDQAQSVSGLFLALFLWTHLLLVSSILLGPKAMSWVASTMELSFLSYDGHGYPWVVTIIAFAVGALVVIHVWVAMQKIPINLAQQKALKQSLIQIDHGDTRLWRWQVITGLVVLLLVPIHLWLIGSAPETIGPEGSANRIWGQGVWLMYLPLLFAAELHGAIGLYRLALKWGVVSNQQQRVRLRKLKTVLSVAFIGVGLLTLAAFSQYYPG